MLAFNMTNSFREMRKRPMNFCLGMSSVFLVVVVAAVCFTIIEKMPVIFLQRAEADEGQIDLWLRSSRRFSNPQMPYLNHTALAENVAPIPELTSHTPRFTVNSYPYTQGCTTRSTDLGFDPLDFAWKYQGFPNNEYDGCFNHTLDCVSSICSNENPFAVKDQTQIVAIDSLQEDLVGLGRSWPYAGVKIDYGSAMVGFVLAERLDLRVGDVFYARVDLPSDRNPLLGDLVNFGMDSFHNDNSSVRGKFPTSKANVLFSDVIDHYGEAIFVPIFVQGIYGTNGGKFEDNKRGDGKIIMEFEHFLPFLVEHLHPVFRETSIAKLAEYGQNIGSSYIDKFGVNGTLQDTVLGVYTQSPASLSEYMTNSSFFNLSNFATDVIMNLPGNRAEAYLSTNYDDVQGTVIAFASRALYYAGYPDVESEMPILELLRTVRFFALFLGLILSIILTVMFLLSTMLLYSLLMISVETRTFEMGVYRMIGMSRFGIVWLLFTQAASFAVPSWVIGLIFSQGVTVPILDFLESEIQVPISKELTATSIIVATVLGLVIPMFAVILPIRIALAKNLHETLDTKHSKTKAVKIELERSEDNGFNVAWFIIGAGLVIFGFLIYYLLPLALLSFNLTLFADIFFGLLLGMLFGLILLSINFESLMEHLVVKVFLWWEKRMVPILVLKNLVAHRLRNRKTTLMYAASIGFIIFITVSFQIELATARLRELKLAGGRLVVNGDHSYARMVQLDGIMRDARDQGIVSEWGALSTGLSDYFDDCAYSNLGHFKEQQAEIYTATANFFDSTADEFLIVTTSPGDAGGVSLTEQLYSVRGSQSALMGEWFQDDMGLSDLTSDSSFLLKVQHRSGSLKIPEPRVTGREPDLLKIFQFKPLAFLESTPRIAASVFTTGVGNNQDFIVSIPTYLEMAGPDLIDGVRDIKWSAVTVKFDPSSTAQERLDFAESLEFRGFSDVFDETALAGELAESEAVMTIVFSIATYIAMYMCLFSLIASMYTNIYEQSKEIGIMRAMGLPSFQIIKIYVYEAFVLTLSSSMLGVLIGLFMAWTITLQRVLFTQLPIQFVFPWVFTIQICIASALCAIVAAFMPARRLMRKTVSSVMRTVL